MSNKFYDTPGFACYIFIIKASDVVLSIFYILDGFIYVGGTRGPLYKGCSFMLAGKLEC